MLTPGQIAPDFTLFNQDGTPIRLSDYRGRKVVLFAFPKANSMGCNAQACTFNDELPKLESGNAVVFGIGVDSQHDMKAWHDARHLNYDLLSDADHAVLTAYGAWGIPMLGIVRVPLVNRSYWVIDERGVLIDQQINVGPGNSVKKALAAVQSAPVAASVV